MAKTPAENANSSGEAEFKIDEIFFSRTDKRGVIQSCNTVFQRISQFNWEKLVGAPHRLIRHPDMPKAVFWLLWNFIQNDKPIGAYVKNKAKDGRYYWVYAIVTPIEDGYLSVRIKPTSDVFDVVKREYELALQRERNEGLTPQESAEALQQRLQELGFADYQAFMTHALAAEMASRHDKLSSTAPNVGKHFTVMLEALSNVQKTGYNIVSEFESIRTTPLNMRIQAAHLGARAACLGVISSNYQVLAGEIRRMIEEFLEGSEMVLQTITEGLFLSCVSAIQNEVIAAFGAEENIPEFVNKGAEIDCLAKLCAQYEGEADLGLKTIDRETKRFTEICISLKRVLSGLSLTRILCEMESKRIGEDAQNMNDIAVQLNQFQTVTNECLKQIENGNLRLINGVQAQLSVSQNIKSKREPMRKAARG